MEFVVQRSKWYRGQGSEESRLLRTDRMKCCIGFVGQQCGIPDYFLLDRQAIWSLSLSDNDPNNLNKKVMGEGWSGWMKDPASDLQLAYLINDDPETDDAYKEERLKQLFAAHGDEISFVD